MSAPKQIATVAATALLVVGLWLLARPAIRPSPWIELHSEHMATTISITVPDDDRAIDANTIVSNVFRDVDHMMSEWKPDSPLTNINHNAGIRPVEAPEELRNLLEYSIELGHATNGAFDVTWAALWGLWDFKTDSPAIPETTEIEQRLDLIDYRRIEVDHEAGTVYLPQRGMMIGLGGIAKGYALGVAARQLRDAGFHDFLIVSGGQVYAAGDKNGQPWRIGIRNPRGTPTDLIGMIELRDASASTSGDYERFFILDNQRYHHILDPRTGQPATATQSATVVSPNATLADALATALLILGPDAGQPLIDHYDLQAFIIDASGNHHELGTPAPPVTGTRADPMLKD